MTKFIITCQVKEWYGHSAKVGLPAYGRYKMKGSQDFVFESTDETWARFPRLLISNFNAKYDRVGSFTRYEAKSIEVYYEPEPAMLVEGEIVVPFLEPVGTPL